jgi:hypothetical protein
LRQWVFGERQPQNYKELFNLRHAQLRNVVERIFGAVKKTCSVLVNMPVGYSIKEQIAIVECCFLVYNFRRIYKEFEDPDSYLEFNCCEFNEYYIPEEDERNTPSNNQPEEDEDEDECNTPGNDVELHENATVNNNSLNKWRDDIAEELWAGYMEELTIRGIPHKNLV